MSAARVGAVALSLGVASAGCVTSQAIPHYGDTPVYQAPGRDQVLVRNHSFIPHSLTVRVGTRVTWLFEDGVIPCDVTGPGFEGPARSTGTWSHVFSRPGVVVYRCAIQSDMSGRIVVRP